MIQEPGSPPQHCEGDCHLQEHPPVLAHKDERGGRQQQTSTRTAATAAGDKPETSTLGPGNLASVEAL